VLLFLFAVIVIYFSEKKNKKTEFLLAAVLFITAAILFKTDFLVELGITLLFPEGKRRSKQA
jgi:hypothetical protein